MTSGRSQESSFIVITLYTESNCTCREKNHTLKYIDVSRTTHTNLDVLMEKDIEDHRNVDGERELSDAWTGFTRFIFSTKGHLMDTHFPVERLARKQNTSRPDDVWPDMWTRKTKVRQCQTIEWNILY